MQPHGPTRRAPTLNSTAKFSQADSTPLQLVSSSLQPGVTSLATYSHGASQPVSSEDA
jgi:hypothetical protein